MKNLRLVYDNVKGERKDITLPMEKWISDWCFECNLIPPDGTEILLAELDGKNVLSRMGKINGKCFTIDDVASHFYWDSLPFIRDPMTENTVGKNKTNSITSFC